MNRQQTLKALAGFLKEHQARCPDPHLHTVAEERTTATELVEMTCPTCGVRVTRTRQDEHWDATWSWPGHNPELHHPGGCPAEPLAHTHDEHGDVQLSFVP